MKSESRSVMSNSFRPNWLYSPWNSPGQNTRLGSLSLLQGIFPNPGIEPRSPTLQADSLAAEPPGKPKNIGVGSLSLLQGIFPNPGIDPGSPALQAGSLPTELCERMQSKVLEELSLIPSFSSPSLCMWEVLWLVMWGLKCFLSSAICKNFKADTLPCPGLKHTSCTPFSNKDVLPCHCLAEIFYHGSKKGTRKYVSKKRGGLLSMIKVLLRGITHFRWWKFAKHSARPFLVKR